MVIIELATHFGEEIRNKVFKDCTLVAIQVALQHIKLCTIFQHADQKSGIFHIDLENIFDRIAVERKLRKGQVIASGNNPCVFDPLQTPGVLRRCSSFSDNRILELFIFFAELLGDRLKAFSNTPFIFFISIFDHIVLVGTNDIPLKLQNRSNLLCIDKKLNCFRHTAYYNILQQELAKPIVKGLGNGTFLS